MTVKEIKQELDRLGVEYDSKARKDELLKLLNLFLKLAIAFLASSSVFTFFDFQSSKILFKYFQFFASFSIASFMAKIRISSSKTSDHSINICAAYPPIAPNPLSS